MDAIRKQLDQLMGANRNGDVREVSRKYYDRDVCRLFLAGLCPHDLFQLTVLPISSTPVPSVPVPVPPIPLSWWFPSVDERLELGCAQ